MEFKEKNIITIKILVLCVLVYIVRIYSMRIQNLIGDFANHPDRGLYWEVARWATISCMLISIGIYIYLIRSFVKKHIHLSRFMFLLIATTFVFLLSLATV